MAVQLDGKATERQRKYIGVLSSQGKEKLGKDFSIRKLAEEQEINWDEMSMEEANKLIKEVKEMIESPVEVKASAEFQVSEQDLINKLAKGKKEKPEASLAPASTSTTHTYMIQLIIPEDKLLPLSVVLEAMRLGYIVLQEVRA